MLKHLIIFEAYLCSEGTPFSLGGRGMKEVVVFFTDISGKHTYINQISFACNMEKVLLKNVPFT